MLKDVKISSIQLSILIMGFLFGSSSILNPATAAYQDAWLAYIIGWAGGFVLLWLYASVALANPSKTLISILRENLGKVLGSLIALLYIWYFIHLAALVLRNFGEYMAVTVYYETPILFTIGCFALLAAYGVKNGLEVMARASEILVPLIFFFVTFIFFAVMVEYDLKNLFPILERGFSPVAKAGLGVLTFPFGETVVFLMVFPALNKQRSLKKVSFISLLLMGLIILNILLRDLWAMGPDMLNRVVFPPSLTTQLIPHLKIDPLIGINLLIGAGVKFSVCLYAAAIGISQLFNLKDYKPFVLPITVICIALSLWIYDNVFEMLRWAVEVWPFYSIPFQIVIPLFLLGISKVKGWVK